jgi:transcriptional regulator with XRE-family HTH domain
VRNGPMVARRRLGTALRQLRETAGMKIEDAAAVLECSAAKISRLENGKGVPYQRDVRDLVSSYGYAAGERLDELLGLAEVGRLPGRYHDYEGLFRRISDPADLYRFYELEIDAAVIKAFEADLVPAILRSNRYVDAVCSMKSPPMTAADRARFVKFHG